MRPTDERARAIEKLMRLEEEDVEKVLIFMAGMDAGKSLRSQSHPEDLPAEDAPAVKGDDDETH